MIGKSQAKNDELDIPANLRRINGDGKPSYEDLLQMVQALQAKVA